MKDLLPKNLDELSPDALRALMAKLVLRHEQVATHQDKLQQVLVAKEAAIKGLERSNKHLAHANKELKSTNEKLELTKKKLEFTNKELEFSNEKLALTNKELEFTNKKLAHELAVIRNYRFGKKSEQYAGVQGLLFEEDALADLRVIEDELERLTKDVSTKPRAASKPKRRPLPLELPRVDIHHEPENKHCDCGCMLKRIGENISEKLDYIPGKAQVERHIRGKWACKKCDTLTQAPMPAHIINKGIASSRLLAHVLVAKYADHLPLYRQQQRFAREGIELPISTMADWVGRCGMQLQPLVDALREELLLKSVLHADETPINVLRADKDRKTHKAYLWAYAPSVYEDLKAVIYDFTPSRAGAHARTFLSGWQGKLVTDDYRGYKKGFEQSGMTEVACMAHARRKFYELHIANKSDLAAHALKSFKALYKIEAEAKNLTAKQRQELRQKQAKPIMQKLHKWMLAQRALVPDGTGTAKALDYSLKRWVALKQYLEDGRVPIDNNHIEQQIRPLALGRKNWLFAGSVRAGQRAAAIMSLIQSAKLNGHDPLAYLKDVLERLPTQPNKHIGELLPHNWQPAQR